jgi:hypothetical protein
MNTQEASQNAETKPDGYTLLATVPCPDCKGDGIIVDVRIEPRCCMNFNEYGGCCNYPLPDQVAEQKQCERCQATGQVPK